ncbi:MAG: glucosaminidase domain-containing protein [Clostridiales bacterium]|nr:glucosaminidase domain-containing protein [Clostridiales bacterium]
MPYSTDEFLAKIKPMVIEDMKKSGILASLTAAQALIESNKGNSGLTQKANNLFGMKGAYNGQSVTMPTTEYYNGVKCTVNAAFRKYPSWADSIADHSGLFNRSARYANLRGLKDYKLACKYVQQDGYATSPTYTQTLLKTIENYKLWTWDLEAEGKEVILPPTGNPYPEPTKNIKLNSKGNDVRWLQWMLNDKGGYKLIIDGIAGPKTIEALTHYQMHHDLVPDGICGPLTRASLKI